ncbi:group I truncated hemoglobin [Streptomyces sp. NBC_00588]|jgi:hemoglobin|uniref:group I truncated hemoglobin n=1 Tax=Streptomyces sp. NBC_00588 TaxID=2975784 RepID=UPI002E819CD5|nr:group 1 truncated hemoglobin [Streptomyces sp. NBC_00588]WUB34790.1 group 1 truncated hemoglobin [Streptomyces sp. NBC_00588]
MTDTTAGTPAPAATPTLFEQLGGEEAVGAVVDLFYDKVLSDPDLQPYFTGVDLDRLKQHQRRFIGQALGATRPYSGRSMRKAHEHLDVTEDAFGRVVTHLAGALAEAGVDEETIGTIAQRLLPLKQEIVTA